MGDFIIRTVVNKTRRPIRISLPRGKTLHLAPTGQGQVQDDTIERPAFKKLIEAGDIELLDEKGAGAQGTANSPGRVQRADQGHAGSRTPARKGDR